MPPKPKFTKEQIVEAAYEIARTEGIDAVMAREVGKKLGSTASPIFTVFSGMDELKQAVFLLARRNCIEYLSGAFDYHPVFKEFGLRWIRFAVREPRVFDMLFLRGAGDGAFLLDEIVGDVSDRVNAGIREAFGLDEARADRLFRQMLIYANGLAVFLNSGVGQLSEAEISRAIGEVCLSLVARYRILDGSLDPEAMRGMLAMPERMPEKGATA